MKVIRHDALLGPTRRGKLVRALTEVAGRRHRSADPDTAGRGQTEQLVPGSEHYAAPATMLLREIIASACYDVTAAAFTLPAPGDLSLQVFPVWMQGSREDPPHQRPHSDSQAGVTPLVTTVYYAEVRGTVGGQLVIGSGAEVTVIDPVEDDLVAFQGSTTHAVNELFSGRRLSIVCNFYLAAALPG